ncbi:hypothetical protein Btru_046631 [Bulinus truncatus]|nr:hypothetical protein Btru_046631 [Bulinus truncatus]
MSFSILADLVGECTIQVKLSPQANCYDMDRVYVRGFLFALLIVSSSAQYYGSHPPPQVYPSQQNTAAYRQWYQQQQLQRQQQQQNLAAQATYQRQLAAYNAARNAAARPATAPQAYSRPPAASAGQYSQQQYQQYYQQQAASRAQQQTQPYYAQRAQPAQPSPYSNYVQQPYKYPPPAASYYQSPAAASYQPPTASGYPSSVASSYPSPVASSSHPSPLSYPSPVASGYPSPASYPSPVASGYPSPASYPSPVASGYPSPASYPSPVASGYPSPGSQPSPAASGYPSPAASSYQSPVTTPPPTTTPLPAELEVEYEVPTTTTTAAPRTAYSQWGQYRSTLTGFNKILLKGLNGIAATLDSLRAQPRLTAQPSVTAGNEKTKTNVNHLLSAFRQVKQIVSAAQSGTLGSFPVPAQPPMPFPAQPPLPFPAQPPLPFPVQPPMPFPVQPPMPFQPGPHDAFAQTGSGQEVLPPQENTTTPSTMTTLDTSTPPTEVAEVVAEVIETTTPAATTLGTTMTTMVISRGVDSLLPIVELPQITYDPNPNSQPHAAHRQAMLGLETAPNVMQANQHRAELLSTIHMLTNEINALPQYRPSANGMHYVVPPGPALSLPPPLPPAAQSFHDGLGSKSYIPVPSYTLTGGGLVTGSIEHVIPTRHVGNGAVRLTNGAEPVNSNFNSNSYFLRPQFLDRPPVPLTGVYQTSFLNNLNPNYFEAPPMIADAPPPPDPRDARLMEQHLAYVSNFTIPDYAPGQPSSIKVAPSKAPSVQLSSLLAKLATKIAASAPAGKSFGTSLTLSHRPAHPTMTIGHAPPPNPQPITKWDGLFDITQQQQQLRAGQWQQFPPPFSGPQQQLPPQQPPMPSQPQPSSALSHPTPLTSLQNFPPTQYTPGNPPAPQQAGQQWAPPRNEMAWPQHQPQPHQPAFDMPNSAPPQPLQLESPNHISANQPPKTVQWEIQQTTEVPNVNHRASNQGYGSSQYNPPPASYPQQQQQNSYPQQQQPPAQPSTYTNYYQQQQPATSQQQQYTGQAQPGTYSQHQGAQPQTAPATENLDPFSSQFDVNGLKPTIFNPQYQPAPQQQPPPPQQPQSFGQAGNTNEFAGLLEQNSMGGQNPPPPPNKMDFSAKGPNPIQLNQFLAQPMAPPKEANSMSNNLDALLGTLLSNGATLTQQAQPKPKATTRAPPVASGTGLVSDRLNDFILGPKSEFRSNAFSEIPTGGGAYDTLNPLAAFMGETPPPPTTTTLAPPGRNGDFLAGFIGVNKEMAQPKTSSEGLPPNIYMYDFQQSQQATPTPQTNSDLNALGTQDLSSLVQKLLGVLAVKQQATVGQG